ncbi:MAG TPA: FecR domain-containing protein [Vicinamibacterales bacterium]|nr:FecR domain-containing protein [Vicinamibacterales bacterium]
MLVTAGALALAATVIVGIRVARVFYAPFGAPEVTVATVESVTGTVLVLPFGRRADPLVATVGARIGLGEVVDTPSSGGTSLRLTTGLAVRVDARSRLRLLSETTLVLDEGAIYVDSGSGSGRGGLEVRTMHGTARDIGTKFEIRVTPASLRVRVRDGLVQVEGGSGSHDTTPGEEVTVDANGNVSRRTVATYGSEWDWAAALARQFEIEGRSLHEFLAWIARENGWRLTFATAALEARSVATILHGSMRLNGRDALDSVLPTSGLAYRIDNGVLTVRSQDGASQE